MERKFKNLNWPAMAHDTWVIFGYMSFDTNLAKTVFEFSDI